MGAVEPKLQSNHYSWEGVGGEGRGVNNKNCASRVAAFSSVCIQSQTEEQKKQVRPAWEQGYPWGKNAPRFNSLL